MLQLISCKGLVTDAGWAQMRALFISGWSKRKIAGHCKCSRSAVQNALRCNTPPSQRKARKATKKAGSTTSKKMAIRQRRAQVKRLITMKHVVVGEKVVLQRGRPRKDGRPRDRYKVQRRMVKASYPSPAAVARKMRSEGYKVSRSTVARDVRQLGLVAYVRPRRCLLLAGDEEKRLKFCRWIVRQPRSFCRSILLSDEKLFDANDHGHRFQYVARENKHTLVPREQSSSAASVMVWAVIGIGFRFLVFLEVPEGSRGINSSEFVRKCLTPLVTLHKRRIKNRILMQDGAKIHWTNAVRDFCSSKHLELLENWPSHSADLNPLENLWSVLQSRVSERGPFGQEQLKVFIQEEFEKVEQSMIDNLAGSFRDRCVECIKAEGKHVGGKKKQK